MPCRVSYVARSVPRPQGSETALGSCLSSSFCAGLVARGSQGGKEMNESSGADHVRQGMDYGETSDVHQVHSAIQREKREPRAGLEPLSIWLIAVYGLAIFFGGAYLGRFSGNFSGDSLDPALVPSHKKAGPNGPGGEQAAELSQADRGKK